MEQGCEHTEGSPIGKCAICDRTVCSECYNDVFGAMICDLHPGLEDESSWELVGFFTDAVSLAERRYSLEEGGITSLMVESDDESIELYVPNDDKDDAFAILCSSSEEENVCMDCGIQYSHEMDACPVCGAKASEAGDDADDR